MDNQTQRDQSEAQFRVQQIASHFQPNLFEIAKSLTYIQKPKTRLVWKSNY